jgi:hypothetical protein
MTSEEKNINNDYPLIPMGEITDEARIIAVRWGDEYFPGFALSEKHKLASDIMNYARRYNQLSRQELLKEIIGDLDKAKDTYTDHCLYSGYVPGIVKSLEIISKLQEDEV